jgi:uncharacterized membrane protein
VQLVSGSLKKMFVESLVDKTHPPLYNILLHFWVSLWGVSEISVRLPSVLLAAGAVAIYFNIVRSRVAILPAVIAALMMCVSGFLIYFGQEARPYALISLIGAANLFVFFRLLNSSDDRNTILAWTASALAMVYAQYFGAVYLMVEGSVLLLCLPPRTSLRALAPAVVAGLCVLPWMWVAFHQHWALTEISWIEKPVLRSLPDFYVATIGWPPVISGWPLLVALAGLAAAGTLRLLRAGGISRDVAIFAAIAFIPPFAAFVLSYLLGVSIWAPRQLITSAFAFIVLVALLIDALSVLPQRVAAAALVLWSLAGAPDGFTRNRVPHYGDIFAETQRDDPHAPILGEEAWTLRSLSYYAPRAHVAVFDLRTANLSLPAPAYYYVCRPNFCVWLDRLEQKFGPPAEPARYPWDTTGWKPQNVILVYRFVRTR